RLRSNRKNLDEFTSYLLLIIACRNTIASAHTNCLIVLLNSARTARVFAFRQLFSSAGRRIIQPLLRFATTVFNSLSLHSRNLATSPSSAPQHHRRSANYREPKKTVNAALSKSVNN